MDISPVPTESTALEWTPQLVQAFWQHYARNRQEDYFTHLFGDRIIQLTRRYYGTEATICDYGCGSGFLLEHILRSHRAAGCDFTPENIEATRRRVGGMPNLLDLFTVADAAKPGRKFDVIYVVETVEHVLEGSLEPFFAALRGLLKPGGAIIATTPNDEDLQAGTVFCPSCRHTFHRWQHLRSFNVSTITAFMDKGGFVATEVFTTDFSAKDPWPRLKSLLRPYLGKYNPHLVYIGRMAD